MNKLTHTLTKTFVAGSTYFFIASQAFAQNANSVSLCPINSDFTPLCNKNFTASGLIYFIIVMLLVVAVVLALIFLIWGGIKYILSGGDKTKVQGARDQIIGSLIGLAIAFAAYFIINIVINIFFGGGGLKGFNLPSGL